MNQIQNNQKSIVKSIPAYGFVKSQEKLNQTKKSQDFCQMFVIFKKKARTLGKKSIPQGMDLKIYRKYIAKPMDFCSL